MTIIIPDSILVSDVKRLTNQLWKLIPMRENEENWVGQLDSLHIEISGLGSLAKINEDENFLILLSKLEGLRVKDSSFSVYRKTVFECISLLRELRL
jgi:hypothetical protein